jgi:hypothetical protein
VIILSILATAATKLAFIGDQGIGPEAVAALKLIKEERAELVVHLGDLGYAPEADPETARRWMGQLEGVLGPEFPYLVTIGNHDVALWSTYRGLLTAHLARTPDVHCDGDYGVQAHCSFRGIQVVLSGVGTVPDRPNDPDHVAYLRTALGRGAPAWRICAWHKNQSALQLGHKTDEVGWEAYETCREGGALVATGHEHSYARTRTLLRFATLEIDAAEPPHQLQVGGGRSFAFVSGIGGARLRPQARCRALCPEWARMLTTDQGVKHGVLFIAFGDRMARGYLKQVDGQVRDRFTVHRQ